MKGFIGNQQNEFFANNFFIENSVGLAVQDKINDNFFY